VTERPLIRLATRGSPLALWQAHRVAALLDRVGVASSLVVIETTGDRELDLPLDRIGGQGVFVKEVQRAVLRGEADAAVHSAKDLPASAALTAPGLTLAAFPERADPRDTLVGGGLCDLPTGSTVATGSARRRAQLAHLRPDLAFVGLRGNLATRLSVVEVRGVSAVVVAQAALDRMAWSPDGTETEVLDPAVVLPQVGQGALAVECRSDDEVSRAALDAIDDPAVRRLVEAERAFLDELGGGCTLPVGAHAEAVDPPEVVGVDVGPSVEAGPLEAGPLEAGPLEAGPLEAGPLMVCLNGMLASGDGRVVLRHQAIGDRPDDLGRSVARYLLDEAGGNGLGVWDDLVAEPGRGRPEPQDRT
jgi:hydroxymethylbilane synthase